MTTKKKGRSATSSPTQRKNLNPGNNTTLTPRLKRLLVALLKKPCSCQELQKRIPANHPPVYIRTLRQDHGFVFFREHKKFRTVDGLKSWYAIYHLTPSDRKKAEKLLGD